MICLKVMKYLSRFQYTEFHLNYLHILSETLCIKNSGLHIIGERNATQRYQGAC